jgi:DNA-binding transcriptional MerR regulator/methylmalonyl-CoA mutase cobalamin-binding subunit
VYTISEAARRASVSPDLLRAWERRYGVITPHRTDAGYRLYDEIAIRRLQAMRRLRDEGWTASAAAAHLRALPDAELPPLETASDGQREATSGPAEGTAASDELIHQYVDGAAALDGAAVEHAIDQMLARGSFEAATQHGVYPALRALGDAWEDGTVSVAGEHAASAAVGRRLGAAFDAAGSPNPRGRRVLVGLPPDARHEFGALGFAVALKRAGHAVDYLGSDLPVADWVAAADTADARAAVIGVPRDADAPCAGAVAAALRQDRPKLLVAFGGAGAGSFGEDALPDDLTAAVSELGRRLRGR